MSYPVGIVPPRTRSPVPESSSIASYVTLRKSKKPDPRTVSGLIVINCVSCCGGSSQHVHYGQSAGPGLDCSPKAGLYKIHAGCYLTFNNSHEQLALPFCVWALLEKNMDHIYLVVELKMFVKFSLGFWAEALELCTRSGACECPAVRVFTNHSQTIKHLRKQNALFVCVGHFHRTFCSLKFRLLTMHTTQWMLNREICPTENNRRFVEEKLTLRILLLHFKCAEIIRHSILDFSFMK